MSNKKIYYDGYVGIGTENPDRELTVAGANSAFVSLKSNGGNRELLIGVDENAGILSSMKDHDLQLRTNNDTKFIVKNDGNVGVGTLAPQNRFHVVGGSSFQGGRSYFSDNENQGRVRIGAAWGIPGLYSEDQQDLVLGVGNERKVLLGTSPDFVTVKNGKLGVGTTEPHDKVHVENGFVKTTTNPGNDSTPALCGFGLDAREAGGSVHAWRLYTAPVGGGHGVPVNSFSIWDYPNNGAGHCYERFTLLPASPGVTPGTVVIDPLGNMGIGTANPQFKLEVAGLIKGQMVDSSDARLKTNIKPIENALDKVAALNGVQFDWKDPAKGTGKQIGVIAQEVEAVVPELVVTADDGFKAVAYDKLTAVLIEAVKELKAENELLRKKIEALESK